MYSKFSAYGMEIRNCSCSYSFSNSVSILSAARNQRNPSLAQKMFDRIEPYLNNQETYMTSATVLLANTYALAGDPRTASMIRMKMNQSGLKKLAGLSWTVVNGKIVVSREHEKKLEFEELFSFRNLEHMIDLTHNRKRSMPS
jgi:hypothetical protein